MGQGKATTVGGRPAERAVTRMGLESPGLGWAAQPRLVHKDSVADVYELAPSRSLRGWQMKGLSVRIAQGF